MHEIGFLRPSRMRCELLIQERRCLCPPAGRTECPPPARVQARRVALAARSAGWYLRCVACPMPVRYPAGRRYTDPGGPVPAALCRQKPPRPLAPGATTPVRRRVPAQNCPTRSLRSAVPIAAAGLRPPARRRRCCRGRRQSRRCAHGVPAPWPAGPQPDRRAASGCVGAGWRQVSVRYGGWLPH